MAFVIEDGSYVFVILGKREDFDRIAAPSHDHGESSQHGGHVLTKSIGGTGCTVVFQFWLKDPIPLELRMPQPDLCGGHQ